MVRVTLEKPSVQLRAERVKAKLPIAIEKSEEEINLGLTEDISASGIYFECGFSQSVGSKIEFGMNIDIASRHLILKCTAEIVRLDFKDNKNYIAAKIIESSLSD